MALIEKYSAHVLIPIFLLIAIIYLLHRFFSGAVYKGPKPDLHLKNVVITGGNTGIGKVTVEELAKLGCRIVIGARDRNKSEEAIKDIQCRNRNADIDFIPLDLSDRSSIEHFAQAISFEKIDYLINNAGVMGLPALTLTKEGF